MLLVKLLKPLKQVFGACFPSCFRLCRICFCSIEGEERHAILRSKSLRGDCHSVSMPLTCWHLVSMPKDLGNWESMRPIFDGVLELYNGSLARSATFWLSSDCLGSKSVICASRAEPRWQQSDELGLVQWCTGHAHRFGYNLVFSNANDNETKCLQHVMATPLVNLEAHLLRLHRIIRLTRGMALLIGVGGSGIVAAMRISRPFAFDAAFWDWSNVHSVSQPSKYSCIWYMNIHAYSLHTDIHMHTSKQSAWTQTQTNTLADMNTCTLHMHTVYMHTSACI